MAGLITQGHCLLERLLGLPPDVLATTFYFLHDADGAQPLRDSRTGHAGPSNNASSTDMRTLKVLVTSGQIGVELDGLLRQWGTCFEQNWKLTGEREVLASMIGAIVQQPKQTGDGPAGKTSKGKGPGAEPASGSKKAVAQPNGKRGGSVQPSTPKPGPSKAEPQRGRLRAAPKDCVLALSLLDTALFKVRERLEVLAKGLDGALAKLAKLNVDCNFLSSLHRTIADESTRLVKGATPDIEIGRRLFLWVASYEYYPGYTELTVMLYSADVLETLGLRCIKVLGIPPTPLDNFDGGGWDEIGSFAERVKTLVNPPRHRTRTHETTPDRRKQSGSRTAPESDEAQSRKRKRKSRSTGSSQGKSSQTDLSMITSSLAAKAMESPRIANLLDGLSHENSSEPSIPPGQGRPLESSQRSEEELFNFAQPQVPVPPMSDDSETDEEGVRRPVKRSAQAGGPARATVQTPARAPVPATATRTKQSPQDNAGRSNNSSLSPSVLAVPSSNRVRASGRPAPSPAAAVRSVLHEEPSRASKASTDPSVPPKAGGRIDSSSEASGGRQSGPALLPPGSLRVPVAGSHDNSDRSSGHSGQHDTRRTFDESGVSITSEDLRALAALVAGASPDFSLSNGNNNNDPKPAPSQPTGWSPSESSQLKELAEPVLPQRGGKRALSQTSQGDQSQPEAKRVRFEQRQPLADKSSNESSGEGQQSSSMFSKILGWVGMGRTSGQAEGQESPGKKSPESSSSAGLESFRSAVAGLDSA